MGAVKECMGAVKECMVCGLGVYGFAYAFCGTNRYITPTLRFSGYTKPPRGCNVTCIIIIM